MEFWKEEFQNSSGNKLEVPRKQARSSPVQKISLNHLVLNQSEMHCSWLQNAGTSLILSRINPGLLRPQVGGGGSHRLSTRVSRERT